MIRLRFFLVLIISVFIYTIAIAENSSKELQPSDFRYGFDIDVPNKNMIYYFDIPEHVYQNISSYDLKDIVVFNSTGDIVPFTTRRPEPTTYNLIPDQNIGSLFHMVGDNQSKEESGSVIINVQRYPINKAKELRLIFNEGSEFNGSTIIELSNSNLENWVRDGEASVVQLKSGDDKIVRNTIKLSDLSQSTQYIKLTFTPLNIAPHVTGATLVFHPDEIYEPYLVHKVVGHGEALDGKSYTSIDLGGIYPIDWISMEMPNSYFFPDYTVKGNIGRHGVSMWYNVTSGNRLLPIPNSGGIKDEGVHLDGIRHRYLQMVTNDIPSSDIQTNIYWRQDQLIFIARGLGPFTVAYGNDMYVEPQIVTNSKESLVNRLTGEEIKLKIDATPTLYGGGTYTPPVIKPTSKVYKIMLYGIIIAIIAGLTGVAVKLLKEVK